MMCYHHLHCNPTYGVKLNKPQSPGEILGHAQITAAVKQTHNRQRSIERLTDQTQEMVRAEATPSPVDNALIYAH